MPKIHLNERVYTKLKEMAGEQNRSVANMAETVLTNAWGRQPIDRVERIKHPDGIIKEPGKATIEALKEKIDAVCTGHPSKRWNCGRKGCEF